MHPLPLLRPLHALVPVLRHREHVRRQVHADHPRLRERAGDVLRADADGAPDVEDGSRLAPGVRVDVRA